ncbi:maleylacetoacetate isomerase [Sphingomonas sp. AX6]|uniref:maleylacetoacetate isomerase n=1 Tax=Sphingomonas sp. AX6 TaxID=2653171 RepID=UPI0012F39145|nr:maleylacetoacetate isomerase [Sphingomonas sp. AX6]VXC72440.1 Maleylacetoacetate isomerase [Sphingomonas sp. AX6]
MYTLYDYYRSSAAYRVRIALNLKDVEYDSVDVSLLNGDQRSPEHLARNPQGFVPVLDVGEGVLTQSLAILDYLDAKHPDPRFVPTDPLARSRTLAMALTVACDIHPLNNLRVLNYLKRELGVEEEARNDWYQHWVVQGFGALERMAGEGPFLGGEAPDMADICLVPQMFNARRFEVDLTPYPNLVAADAAAQKIEAFAAAHPDRVKPAS